MSGLSIGLTSGDVDNVSSILSRGRQEKRANRAGAYANEMMKGSQIDVNSPEYDAPAHIAAGAMIHTRNMQDENYRAKVMQRKAAEIDEQWKMKAGHVEKVVNRYKQTGNINELRESTRLLYNSSANPNGEQFERIIPGSESESGKDMWEIKRDDGSTVYRDVLDPEGIVKRLTEGVDPQYFRTTSMKGYLARADFNAKALIGQGERAKNKEGKEIRIVTLKDQTGMPYQEGIDKSGKRIKGDELNQYKFIKDIKDDAALESVKAKTGLARAQTEAAKDKGQDLNFQQKAEYTRLGKQLSDLETQLLDGGNKEDFDGNIIPFTKEEKTALKEKIATLTNKRDKFVGGGWRFFEGGGPATDGQSKSSANGLAPKRLPGRTEGEVKAIGLEKKAKEKQAEGGNFNPEGSGYDDETAKKYNLKPNAKTNHMQSRVELPPEVCKEKGLPPGSGLLLKGKKHKTWDLLVKGEKEAGYEIFKHTDGRYYSRKLSKSEKWKQRGKGKVEKAVRSAVSDYTKKLEKKPNKPHYLKKTGSGRLFD